MIILKGLKRTIAEEPISTRLFIYGSYARGDYNSSSDVDVMILVKMSDNEIKKVNYPSHAVQ